MIKVTSIEIYSQGFRNIGKYTTIIRKKIAKFYHLTTVFQLPTTYTVEP
jgi:hypothetical protein